MPGLGVNLLFAKKMCEGGLRGSFNNKALRFQGDNGKTMVMAKERGGSYVVEEIAKGINDEFALASIRRP